MPFQSCSIDKPLASFSYWLSLSLHLCLGAFFFFLLSFFTVHRTAARDMSVNVVERDLNHILVMRYGPRLVLLSPDGKGMGTEERRTSRYNGAVGKSGEPASGRKPN